MRTGRIDANEVQAESQEAPDSLRTLLAYFSHTTMPEKTLPLFGAASQAGEGAPAIDDAYPLNAGGYSIDAVSSILASGGLPLETTAPYRNDEGDVVSWRPPDGLEFLLFAGRNLVTRRKCAHRPKQSRRHRRVLHGVAGPLESAADERRRGRRRRILPESIDGARRKATPA